MCKTLLGSSSIFVCKESFVTGYGALRKGRRLFLHSCAELTFLSSGAHGASERVNQWLLQQWTPLFPY